MIESRGKMCLVATIYLAYEQQTYFVAYVRCSQATICVLHNCFWNRYRERADQLLGTLRSNDATATRTSLKK